MNSKRKRPYLGHSVENGKIRHTSVSQIKLYDPKSDGCPRKWAFAYRFGKKLKKTMAKERGIDRAEKLEHYATTGEDVLPPDMQPIKKFLPKPGPDLECEEPLGDMEKAVALRDALLNTPPGTDWSTRLSQDIWNAAGLCVAGIPVDGAADIRHVRGTWIDADGNLHQEHPNTRVVNIFDLKMVSRIYPHKILKGENAGKILPAFTLTDAEICHDTQMLGYARHTIFRRPDTTHVRLQLGYANTSRREAVLRQGLISVDQILSRWDRVEGIARQMEQTATADKIEDVEPNIRACDAFTHVDPMDPEGKKTLKGCGYRYVCPLSIHQSVSTMLGIAKEPSMSLFDQTPQPEQQQTQTPAPPPMTDAAHAAAVEEAKRKLREEAARVTAAASAPPPPVVVDFGFCSKCGTKLVAENASRLPTGEVKHIGCSASAAPPPPVAPSVHSPIAVNPPDQPRAATALELAAPVPAAEVARIEDPEIKAVVEEHARQHADKAAKEAAAAEAVKVAAGAVVWCPMSTQKIVITTDVALAKKWACTCGKTYTLGVLKPIKEGDQNVSVVPRHKPPKKDGETVAPPPPVEPQISIHVEGEDDEDEGDAVVEFVAPPPPVETPAPPPVNVLVESGRTSYADARVNNPPRADVEIASSTNGNGHANGHSVVEMLAPPPLQMTHGTRAFRVDVHAVYQDSAGTRQEFVEYVVLAASMKEAMGKAEKLGEVVSIEAVPGQVIS